MKYKYIFNFSIEHLLKSNNYNNELWQKFVHEPKTSKLNVFYICKMCSKKKIIIIKKRLLGHASVE